VKDGYFSDASLIRRVHREQVVALSGARALLMQAAHPVAFEGFFASTGALSDPYPRLARTAAVMRTITFGDRAAADEQTARVRAVHRRVRGRLREPAGVFPAGTAWAADDPQLLLWVIATLVDSAAIVYERYVGGLRSAQREALWSDYRVVGRLFGLRDADMPSGWAELRGYLREMLDGDVLHVTPRAREVSVRVVLHPPVPLATRPLLELVNFITVGLLPGSLRRQYGLRWDPLRGLALRGGAECARRVLMPVLPRGVRHVKPRTA
jgi:uncharacterized protein (DUF2236 family)